MRALLNSTEAKTGIVVIIGLCLLTFVLNYPAFFGYWRWDDPSILFHIHRYSFWQDFLTPEVWQEFSPSNLTPWLSLSFEVDLILFGLNSGLFYLHQLLALAAVAFALYCTLCLWVLQRLALLGACLFLSGAPVVVVAQQLMTRHYIEGAAFCLLALALFVQYLRQAKLTFLLLSAVCYLIAVTAKETYVPLVVMLVFLPEKSLTDRIKAATPHITIAACYTLWRGYMLGSLSGGYTESASIFSIVNFSDVASTFLRLPALLFGSLWPLATAFYLALVAGYIYFSRGRMSLVFLTVLLILIPMVPLVSFPGINIADRYLFLPWLGFCFSLAFFSDRVLLSMPTKLANSTVMLIYPLLAVIFTVSLFSAIRLQSTVRALGEEFDAHGEFIWQSNQGQAFFPTDILLASYWYVSDLIAFRESLTGESNSPAPIIDPVLSASSATGIWRYQDSCTCLQNTGDSLTVLRQTRLANVDNTAALSLSFEYSSGYFDWKFGPYANGQYHVVSDQLGLLPVPRSGRLRVDIAPQTEFYLRYTSAEGWVTYSESQRIEPDGQRVIWERN